MRSACSSPCCSLPLLPQQLSLPASAQGGLKNPALAGIHHILTVHNMALDSFLKMPSDVLHFRSL